MSKHTPGPWNCTRASAGGHNIITSEVTPVDVCVVSKYGKSQEEINANCLILGAAPELLEALQEVVPMLESMLMLWGDPEPGSIGHKARAAIAKATGGE